MSGELMGAENEVEIRFRVVDEKSTPSASSSPAPSSAAAPPIAVLRPAEYAQKERDAARRTEDTLELERRFEKFEHRLQHRMKHLAARLIASSAVDEIGGIVGVENSFVARLGESAIDGALIGGASGAAIRSVLTIVHELINQVKQNGDDVKRLRELGIQREQVAQDKFVDYRIELGQRVKQQEEDNRQALEDFNQRVRDYLANAVRYISVPYTGRG